MRRNSNKRLSASAASFPLEHRALRQMCRGGIALKQERVYWWPVFVRQTQPGTVTEYPAAVKAAAASFADRNVRSFDDVLSLLCDEFGRIEQPVLKPLFRLVCAEFDTSRDGPALVHLILSTILKDRERFSDFTEDAVLGNCHAFRKVLEKNMPKTHRSLRDIGALEDEFLGMMFRDFFRELLSRPYYSSILDGYMLEGVNMLLRYAMGLVFAYKKEIKAGNFKSGHEFWSIVRQQNGREKFAMMQDYAFETEISFAARVLSMKYALSNKQISNLASQIRSEKSGEHQSSRKSLTSEPDAPMRAKVSVSFASSPILLESAPEEEAPSRGAFDSDDHMQSTPSSTELDTPERAVAENTTPPSLSPVSLFQVKQESFNDQKPLVLPHKPVEVVDKKRSGCCPC